MVEHTVSETKRAFKGTTHKNSCLFYHDAMSLMTAKETRKWAKEKGYKAMCILTGMNLYTSYPGLKRYRSRTDGISPEHCNIDLCLNEDLHKAVDFHVRYTRS